MISSKHVFLVRFCQMPQQLPEHDMEPYSRQPFYPVREPQMTDTCLVYRDHCLFINQFVCRRLRFCPRCAFLSAITPTSSWLHAQSFSWQILASHPKTVITSVSESLLVFPETTLPNGICASYFPFSRWSNEAMGLPQRVLVGSPSLSTVSIMFHVAAAISTVDFSTVELVLHLQLLNIFSFKYNSLLHSTDTPTSP